MEMLFIDFLSFLDTDPKEKQNVVQLKKCVQTLVFAIEIVIEENELVVAECLLLDCLYVGKRVICDKKAIFLKTPNFFSQNPCYCGWKLRIWSRAGSKPTTSSLQTAMTPDTCFIEDTNSVDLNSALHGQFQRKKERRLLT